MMYFLRHGTLLLFESTDTPLVLAVPAGVSLFDLGNQLHHHYQSNILFSILLTLSVKANISLSTRVTRSVFYVFT
jgi:hypothetical protein